MLFEQIAANKRKTILVMLLFFILLSATGAAIGFYFSENIHTGVIIALIVAIVYVSVMSLNSSEVVMMMNGARHIKERDEHPRLWDTVEQMAMVAQIPMPAVYIVRDDSINAFATGFSPKNSAVAVTTGLLSNLQQYELEAVVAHEVSHIRNYDVRLATVALALVAAVALLSDIALRMFRYGGFNKKNDSKIDGRIAIIIYIVAFALILAAPFLATLLQLFLSRNREYLADASAVELTRNPQGLVDALEKIKWHGVETQNASPTSQSIYFVAFKSLPKEKAGWFDTHPPITLRIERIKAM